MPAPVGRRNCQHMKVSGTQCGSPPLRGHSYCYFHIRWHRKGRQVNPCLPEEDQKLPFPGLEDANSIRRGAAQMRRQLEAKMIDDDTASLLFYALQLASTNLKFTSFETRSRHGIE